MPIKPENKALYGKGWPAFAEKLKENAGWKCQQCGAAHRTLYRRKDGNYARVILTVAHLDHNPRNNRGNNLRVLCQRCHLAHDQQHHLEQSALTRARKRDDAHANAGQLGLLQ